MEAKTINEIICLKQFITEKEYKEVNQLEELCYSQDKTNLKLELDYKLGIRSDTGIGLKEVNEYLYYVDDTLVAYLGISSFGGSNIGEVNGMTHPDFRKKGLFKKLFDLAMVECQKRGFDKLLLLSDGKSESGIAFINSVYGEYDFSEYRMKIRNKPTIERIDLIRLRKAGPLDTREIGRQNAIFFNIPEQNEGATEINHSDCLPEDEDDVNKITYMVELDDKIIGKIKVSYSENSAFISAFGILPEVRGKGYGKAALKEALRIIIEKNIDEIELDVECKNSTALNLYKACGFVEQSVMNYYKC